jgi:hypothetical protein
MPLSMVQRFKEKRLVPLVQLVGSEMATIKRFEDLECGKALRELTNITNKTN